MWPGAGHPVAVVHEGIKPSDFLRMAVRQHFAEVQAYVTAMAAAMNRAANANTAAIVNAPAGEADTRETSGFTNTPGSFVNTPSQTSIYGCHPPSPPPKWNEGMTKEDLLVPCEIFCHTACEIAEHACGMPPSISISTCALVCFYTCQGLFGD